LRGAPRKGDGTPDRSLADFMWCKWAIGRGWAIEETAAKLSKALCAPEIPNLSRQTQQGDIYPSLTWKNAPAGTLA
jgi:hypothetical protein